MAQQEQNRTKTTSGACMGCAIKDRCLTNENDCQFTRKQRWKALFIAYILPLILMLAIIAIEMGLGLRESTVGISILAGLGMYYFLLWVLKPKI